MKTKTTETQKAVDKDKCKARIGEHYKGRMDDIRRLWKQWREDSDVSLPDLGTFNEYGLSFDYVPPETFTGQRRGYWRWQLSWGGPSDEFRFYGEIEGGYKAALDCVEYWFMDWHDGAKKNVHGRALELLTEIFDDFAETGTLFHTHQKATEE